MRRGVIVAAAVVALAGGVWFFYMPSDRAAVQARLRALAETVNRTTDGLTPEKRAVQLGAFFTDDVEVDLGKGAVPIRGRATLIGMAERLQPRTSAFRVEFEDVTVTVGSDGTADVHLTAEFIRRNLPASGESLDAREFTLRMRRVGEDWQIATVTSVETLK